MRKLGWMLTGGLTLIGFIGSPAVGRPSQAESEWPVYGADLANSRTVPGGPSPVQVRNLKQAWSDTFTDGDFEGTPVIFHHAVFVGSSGGIVRALSAGTGAVTWSTKLSGSINGSLAATATDDGDVVFVPVAQQGSPKVVALNAATGRPLWSTILDTSADADVYGSPVPVGADGRQVVLQGVSATSGDPASPLRGSLSELDAATGAVIWKSYMVPPADNGGAVWSTPAVDVGAGTVYVGTGNAYTGTAAPTTDSIVKLALTDGRILGWFQGSAGDVFSSSNPGLDFDFGASPNLIQAGGRTIVGEGQKSGSYWAVDTRNMSPIWHATVGAGSALGGVLGSTAYDRATGRVVGPESLPGYIWSLSAPTGQLAWAAPGGVDPVQLSPTSISNGVVYSVTSTGFLEAWNESSGLPLGAVPMNSVPPGGSYTLGLGSGVAIADGFVVADLGSGQSQGIVAAFHT